jgi:tetratricopeptide (TPR) repeat protein
MICLSFVLKVKLADSKNSFIMKLSIFLTICLPFYYISAISQPVATTRINKADSLMNEGNIPEAITEYKKLYSLNPKDQQIVYNYACALSIDNSVIRKFDSCFKYLNTAIELDTAITALMEPNLIPAREDKNWNIFENRLISMLNIKYKNPCKDIEYAKDLWRLGAYDQAYFNEIGIAGRKLGMRSSVASAIWKLKFMIQKKSQKELEQLVTVNGWPKISDVGSQAAMAAYLVAIHTNDGSQKKYLPMIRQTCEENELPWQRYANIFDRCLFNENKPQKYGTHTRFNEQTKSEELYPLEDETKVDEWRKELGLEPLAEYLARFNIKFPQKN